MTNNLTGNAFGKAQPEDKHFRFEEKIFNSYLKNRISTCTQACEALGIKQKNATRYVDNGKKANRLWVVKIGTCPVTRYPGVQFITTNEKWKPKQLQATLFDGIGEGAQ